MKVYENHGPALDPSQTKLKHKDQTGTDFKRIMDQTLCHEPPENPTVVQGNLPLPPGGVTMIHGTEKHDGRLNITEKEKIVSTIRDTLNMIDFYALKLSDTSVPSQDMTPLIDDLEDRMNSLHTMESVPGMPDKLRNLVSDLVITVGTEIAKFRRGDYA